MQVPNAAGVLPVGGGNNGLPRLAFKASNRLRKWQQKAQNMRGLPIFFTGAKQHLHLQMPQLSNGL